MGAVMMALLVVLPACSQQKPPREVLASDTATLERLYNRATIGPQQRRAVRKPVREARARAMRQLADHADAMIARADEAPVAMALTGAPRDDAIAAWKRHLVAIERAAADRDPVALKQAYARLAAAYPDLDVVAARE